MLSSVCEPGLEKVAETAPDALRFCQLYVRGDEAWVDDYAARAVANRYSAFCLTVDTAIYSRRERDIAKRHVVAGRRRASGREFQAALDWRTVERLKKRFDIPLAIKGIATAEDVKIALDHGVEWIYVSNHGGRQLDHGRRRLRARDRHRQGDRRGRQPGRARTPAMLRASGRRRRRAGAAARTARGRGGALVRGAWGDGR